MIASLSGRRRRGAPDDRSLGCVLRPSGLATVRGAREAPGPTYTRARGTKNEPTLYGASDVKRFRPRLSSWPRRSFGPGGTSFSFQPLRASEAALAARSPCWLARADQPSRLPPRATLSDTVRRLEGKLVGESRASTIRGELAIGRRSSRHTLVFGRPTGARP